MGPEVHKGQHEILHGCWKYILTYVLVGETFQVASFNRFSSLDSLPNAEISAGSMAMVE